MSSLPRAAIAERKALLATRAELDRLRVTLAARDVRTIVKPIASAGSFVRSRPMATMLVGLGGPLLGLPRLGRWVRIGSLLLTGWRIMRSWRGGR
jgi:hypothetical protein